jgi:hypothetical protein
MKTPLAETFPSFKDSIRNAADIDATIDFKASFDSLEIMEGVTRHFFLRALIEESMGSQTDWNAVDSLMLKALAAAEKVARYRHAQLSAIKLAGDINAKVTDGASLDDLLVKIKGELEKLKPILGPIFELEVRASRRAKNETAYPRAGWSGSPSGRWTAPERDVRLRKGQSTPRSVLRLRRPLAWFRSGGPRAGSGCRL